MTPLGSQFGRYRQMGPVNALSPCATAAVPGIGCIGLRAQISAGTLATAQASVMVLGIVA